ncbi:formylglycine-generating enzyme family protein [Halomonas sp. M20]|uniref:formylglycine-generating enzyme family protein n=1 Tax=Halomonas sp. M20 TaxID=2763264 RepID=UPI001D0B1EED|nr:SUMF1/EgtB/PvdO family nonheme iron enzyme [Halomonas sp. M20]
MAYRSIMLTNVSLIAIVGVSACTAVVGSAQAEPPPDFKNIDAALFTSESAPQSARARETMITVPAGRYTLGRSDGPAIEQPEHAVELQAFQIDRTEVTNAAFAEYLNALDISVSTPFKAGRASRDDLSDDSVAVLMEESRSSGLYPIIALDDAQARIGYRDGAFRVTQEYEDHPVTESTWAGARAYCEWRGARLPTEAQWEAAARGSDASLYPWGNTAPDDSRVFVSGRTGVTGVVGDHPDGASELGALDMSGSLAEWTSSLMRPYPYDPDDGREAADQAGERVTRGGDYIYDANAATLTATHRNGFSNAPGRGHRHIGFRCAADIDAQDG